MKRFTFFDRKKTSAQNTKTSNNSIFKKPAFLKLIYASFIINIISIIGVIILQNFLPPELPLFYGLAEGEEQLTNKSSLIFAPVVSLCIMLVNLLVVYLIRNEFLKKTLIMAGFFVSLLSTITTVQIILLVGYF